MFLFLSSSSMKKKPIYYEELEKKQIQDNNGFTSLSLTNSSPTPVFIGKQSIQQTQLQAIDSVITELKTSAMVLYFQMAEDGVKPDCFTFPRLLKACGGIGSIQHGGFSNLRKPQSFDRRQGYMNCILLYLALLCQTLPMILRFTTEAGRRGTDPNVVLLPRVENLVKRSEDGSSDVVVVLSTWQLYFSSAFNQSISQDDEYKQSCISSLGLHRLHDFSCFYKFYDYGSSHTSSNSLHLLLQLRSLLV